jgi:hypothetical protein
MEFISIKLIDRQSWTNECSHVNPYSKSPIYVTTVIPHQCFFWEYCIVVVIILENIKKTNETFLEPYKKG